MVRIYLLQIWKKLLPTLRAVNIMFTGTLFKQGLFLSFPAQQAQGERIRGILILKKGNSFSYDFSAYIGCNLKLRSFSLPYDNSKQRDTYKAKTSL